MIKQTLTDQMKTAMRAKDSLALDALRYALSQIKYKEIDLKRELTDQEITVLLASEIKKRIEAMKLFADSGRTEVVTEEKRKIEVLQALLPTQLSDEQLQTIINDLVAQMPDKSFGIVMKSVMKEVVGKADGSRVSEMVKRVLETYETG